MRLFYILVLLFFCTGAKAQRLSEKEFTRPPLVKRIYLSNDLNFLLLSSSLFASPGRATELTTPRFSAWINAGLNLNFEQNRRLSFFTGLNVKNIGFIDKTDVVTTKHRVYSLGIPVGVKFGDLEHRNHVFLGGGIDLPFHYKVKSFGARRGDKEKSTEWFGDQTPRVLPFLFLGKSWHPGITLKLQYYPGNFLNTEYFDEKAGLKPFEGHKVNLLLLALGFDLHFDAYRIQNRESEKWRRNRPSVREL